MTHTEQFIKMCKAAREIQDAWKPEEGDRVWYEKWNSTSLISSHHHIVEIETSCDPRPTWLPSQEQLQAMIGNFGEQLTAFMNRVKQSETGTIYPVHYLWGPLNSMKIMWLQIMMDEKYHKRWENGKEWVQQ